MGNHQPVRRGLVVWGASGHALVVADVVRTAGDYDVVAFFEDVGQRASTELRNLPVLKSLNDLRQLRDQGVTDLIVAFGNCNARLRAAAVARDEGFRLAVAVHPSAVVSVDARIGDGTVIVAGAVINAGSSIGDNVIVNTGASVDHECQINDGVHLGPGTRLGGRVKVGRAAWIGIGAIVKDCVNVGANAIVGAGAVVLSDVPENMVAYGVPARVVREVTANEN